MERFRGRAAAQDPAALGRALQAAYLVTGSVQRAGDRVRLRYEVIRAATRAQVAGDVIDRASGDLLTVESDIAEAVTAAITGQLLPAERTRLSRPLTSDPVAYEQYLRGLQAAHNFGDEAALRSAVAYFDRAIARDSSFAAAFAGKAVAWSMLADGYVTPREGYGQTRERRQPGAGARLLAGAGLGHARRTRSSPWTWTHTKASGWRAAGSRWTRTAAGRASSCPAPCGRRGRPIPPSAEARRAWQDDSLFTIHERLTTSPCWSALAASTRPPP